jgi:hypothetical protein
MSKFTGDGGLNGFIYRGCCRKCFAHYYGIGMSTITKYCTFIKAGEDKEIIRNYNDRSAGEQYSGMFKRALDNMAKNFKKPLDHSQIAAMNIPNTHQSLVCFGWMYQYFELMGDRPPDCEDGELHLEPITTEEVWTEYKLDMASIHEDYIAVSTFGRLWEACFRHVKTREYKAVNLKCETCERLCSLRRSTRDTQDKEHIKILHKCHRSAYMNERLSYYKRRQQGIIIN